MRTATPDQWLDLAERIEEATGPDREKACPRCGALFAKGAMPPSQWSRKIYCSPQCGSAHFNENNRHSAASALALLFRQAEVTSNGCVIPRRKTDASGYVVARADGRLIKAHRLSYLINKGETPPGMVVMHTCDVRNCINPSHLVIGTNTDNTRDRDEKKRQARGERQGRAKLTEAAVREIRLSPASDTKLALQYGVGPTTINNIRTGKRWAHVE
jgi:hypothetical protein